MNAQNSQDQSKEWLLEHGPQELERLLQAVLYLSSTPVLLADNDHPCRHANSAASKLLGLPREAIAGQSLDDFATPTFTPLILERWQRFLQADEREGTLPLMGDDGGERELEYSAQKDVLPCRHLLLLRDKSIRGCEAEGAAASNQDYALSLLDLEGNIVAWYAGAERVFGYKSGEAHGGHVSQFHPDEGTVCKLRDVLKRAAREGHGCAECWQVKKDGTRFWANCILLALKDERGTLQGFASVVRDFSERRERDEKLRRGSGYRQELLAESVIAGVVSGEFDRILEANGAFLELVGYSRAELVCSGMRWAELSPPESLALAEAANEDGILSGASTPVQSQLMRKDGSRVPALVTLSVLELAPLRWTALVQKREESPPPEQVEWVEGEFRFGDMVGRSKAIEQIKGQIEMVAPTDATVLILGETGTGKELVARGIHRMSSRRNLPFVTLNCASIPTGLLESELFGYERGAFTGALTRKIGRFEMAQHGTLFLDEVGDIPFDLQPKLLRALQEKTFERLGGTKTIPIDVRILAATNRNLEEMMAENLFRGDLYHRLKVFPITSPPLRERPEDIPLLVRHFTNKFAAKMKRTIETISSDTMKQLLAWPWPGNIRELENFIQRSVIFSPGPELRAPLAELRNDGHESNSEISLEQVERNHILKVLRTSRGSVSLTADKLGLPRTTLNARMKKLKISRSDI